MGEGIPDFEVSDVADTAGSDIPEVPEVEEAPPEIPEVPTDVSEGESTVQDSVEGDFSGTEIPEESAQPPANISDQTSPNAGDDTTVHPRPGASPETAPETEPTPETDPVHVKPEPPEGWTPGGSERR